MSSVNRVILVGRIGKKPEIKTVGNDQKVCTFSVATSEKIKDQEVTEWHNVVSWNKLAEIVFKYTDKGSLIYIDGKIKTEVYDKDGVKKEIKKIVANSIQLLGKATVNNESAMTPEAEHPQEQLTEDDMPF